MHEIWSPLCKITWHWEKAGWCLCGVRSSVGETCWQREWQNLSGQSHSTSSLEVTEVKCLHSIIQVYQAVYFKWVSFIVCTVDPNKARRKEVKRKEGRQGGKKGRREGGKERRKTKQANWVWTHIPVILVLGRLRQENFYKFKASLSYLSRPCFERNKEGGERERDTQRETQRQRKRERNCQE